MGRAENVFPCTHWHLRKCLLVMVQISSHPNFTVWSHSIVMPSIFYYFYQDSPVNYKAKSKLKSSPILETSQNKLSTVQQKLDSSIEQNYIILWWCTSSHFNHRVYICNCLQNIGFQVESVLCEQCVLLGQLLSEKLQISIMVFTPKFNKFK